MNLLLKFLPFLALIALMSIELMVDAAGEGGGGSSSSKDPPPGVFVLVLWASDSQSTSTLPDHGARAGPRKEYNMPLG
jgi:hypothetical protein